MISATDTEAQPYLGGAIGADLWTATTGYQIAVDDVLVTPFSGAAGFAEDFDAVTVPALPANWITTTNGNGFSGSHAPTSRTPLPIGVCARVNEGCASDLITPSLTLPPASLG